MMEFLKDKSENVTILHVGARPRYFVNKFKTNADKWRVIGDFKSDLERDTYAIQNCTHFLTIDFNSNENRKSGSLKTVEYCLNLDKMRI
ncbi:MULTISPECIES: hypothetical protein [unclassified Chryseobacterium]|uniref:hypothetical protein n=1 Tax=unclassified Chryseobacterium TaxID=2593645 RepID=UPI0009E92877|nr:MULTISPECIES: hypothetical protein [unclassified Chryseobacterium]